MDALIATFRSPGPDIFHLGPLVLRWYGLLIASSVLIGLNLSKKLAAKRNIELGFINDLMPIIVLSSLIGARIYYVIFEWERYQGNYFWSSIKMFNFSIPIPSPLEIWNGGIAIHGALIAGSISVIIFSRLKKQFLWDVLDVICPSVALGQAIGRWGNFFNNEAFGTPTSLPWKLSIPFIYRPEGLANYEYFHPTFLYESVWNIILFTLLIFIFSKGSKGLIRLPSGAITCIYITIYSIGRLWIEGLRTDSLCIGGLPPLCEGGIRVAQLISLILSGLGLLGIWWLYVRKKKLPGSSKS